MMIPINFLIFQDEITILKVLKNIFELVDSNIYVFQSLNRNLIRRFFSSKLSKNVASR